MNRKSLIGLAFLSATTLTSSLHAGAPEATVHYRVTVQNLTGANVLSPYLSVVHKLNSNIFTAGAKASPGLQQLAETGGTSTIQDELSQNPYVISVKKADGAPIVATEKRTIEIDVSAYDVQSGARFTILAMIGKSNDSFVSFKNINLKDIKKGQYFKVRATNYDAGTEENTGNVEDLGSAGHPTANVEGHISFDRGLNPRGNAPEWLGWDSNAAEVQIERTN